MRTPKNQFLPYRKKKKKEQKPILAARLTGNIYWLKHLKER